MVRFFFVLFWFIVSFPVFPRNSYYSFIQSFPAKENPYLQELLEKAEEKKIYEQRTWRILLHYEKERFGSYKSAADTDNFFLAPNGSTNASSELRATLTGFFIPQDISGDVQQQYHPRCNFPARFMYLKQQLDIDESRLPGVQCTMFDKMYDRIRAKNISLIFATYYASDPASMFGHTLLKMTPVQGDEVVAVNFAADTSRVDAVRYVLYGLFGGFQGDFSFIPYRRKIKQYAFNQNRDVWEYELDLTPDEIQFIQYHIWELKTTRFDYFYMTENCSYRLLALIELVRPELYLREKFPLWVVPGETIREVVNSSSIVKKTTYHPSIRNRILYFTEKLSESEKDLFYELLDGDYSPGKYSFDRIDDMVAPEHRIEFRRILRLALQYMNVHKEERLTAEQNQFVKSDEEDMADILMTPVDPPGRVRPVEEGHGLWTLTAGGGFRSNDSFTLYRLRPVMHDFLNRTEGFPPRSELQYGDLQLRYYHTSRQWALHRLTLLRIVSLGWQDALNWPSSFYLDVGVEAHYDTGTKPNVVEDYFLKDELYTRSQPAFLYYMTNEDQIGIRTKRDYIHWILTDYYYQDLENWNDLYSVDYYRRDHVKHLISNNLDKRDSLQVGYRMHMDLMTGKTLGMGNLASSSGEIYTSLLVGARVEGGEGIRTARITPHIMATITGATGDVKMRVGASYFPGRTNDTYAITTAFSYHPLANQELRLELVREERQSEGSILYSLFF